MLQSWVVIMYFIAGVPICERQYPHYGVEDWRGWACIPRLPACQGYGGSIYTLVGVNCDYRVADLYLLGLMILLSIRYRLCLSPHARDLTHYRPSWPPTLQSTLHLLHRIPITCQALHTSFHSPLAF